MTPDKPIQEMTLGQILDRTATRYPDHDAVVYADRGYRLTWRQFNEQVDRLARGLMALGVQKDEKVAVWASNVPHWVALQFATARIGAVLLTINTNYRSTELDYVLRQSDAQNLFIIDRVRDTDFLSTVYELVPELKTMARERMNASRYPRLKRLFFMGPEKHRGFYSMPELLALAPLVSDADYRARQAVLRPSDVVNMQYTSGTTGFPKGVMLTHINIGTNGWWIGKNQNLSGADRVCIPVPLFHCFGCVLGVMACVNHGATMVILEKYEPVAAMQAVEAERCTGLYGVPTMFIAILEHPLRDKFNFSTLRTGIMAGSPCPVKSMRQCVDILHMHEVTICYGLTENSPVMTQTLYNEPDLNRKCSTVGRAMPGIEVAIFNPDTGERCPPNVPGEVCCRGYSVMRGYYKMPDETALAIDQDGWLHSGDVGVVDEQGYFAITGRIKDMIIRGGENIYPKEIEDFIHPMPGVQDVQVVGVPSKKYGEQPGAFIILKPGAALTETDVQDFCRNKISWYKIPKYVTFIQTYPQTASGKIQKYKLREEASRLWPDA